MYVSPQHKGFTLLELMITVAVVGILAAISIPSYMSHMVKVRRAAAAACLMEGAQYAERSYTTNMKYANMEIDKAFGGCRNEINTHYELSLKADDKTYTLTATPINRQLTSDTKCAALTIDNTGAKGITGSGKLAECW